MHNIIYVNMCQAVHIPNKVLNILRAFSLIMVKFLD